MKLKWPMLLVSLIALPALADVRGTGDMGIIIERATGQLLIVEHSNNTIIKQVDGLGDLSHASVVIRVMRVTHLFSVVMAVSPK